MAEFEDKLNSILGNQAAMNQIMALARSLSGEQPAGEASPAPEEPGEAAYAPAGEASAQPAPDLAALMGQIDPQMIQVGMDVIRQVQSTEDRNAALLNALRPFLREEKQARLDRALRVARMTRLVRVALSALGGKEGERV
ncbi:MAG: hypothetical protein HFF51_03800 [Lawsonibacter sp.]|nr:hypothetical protein [Lawsonibacter sp.]